jgi:hypothetical protein
MVPSVRKILTAAEFHACIHPLQRTRFVLAVTFTLLLAPVMVGLAGVFFYLVPVIVFAIWIGGRVLFARYLGNSILVSSVNYPRIHAISEEVKATLDYQKPIFIFVYEQGNFNAFMRKLFTRRAIFLNSEILEAGVSDDEVRWLIGRFVGYLRARAGFWGWLIRLAEAFFIFNLFLLPYERALVYTGDRLALAVIGGDISSAVSAMQKLLVGRQLGYSVNPEGIVDQHRQVKGSFFALLARLASFYPHSTARYVDLIVFAKSAFPAQYARFAAANPGLPQDIASLASAAHGPVVAVGALTSPQPAR